MIGFLIYLKSVIIPKTKKMSMKCIASILVADMFLSTMIGALVKPMDVWAATIPDNPPDGNVPEIAAGDEMVNNWGTVGVNNGTIQNNAGTVNENNGYIADNFGAVSDNCNDDPSTTNIEEGVHINHNYGTVGSATENTGGDVGINFGTVNHAHKVEINAPSGTVNGAETIDYDAGSSNNVTTVTYDQASNPGPYSEINSMTDDATAPDPPQAPDEFKYEPAAATGQPSGNEGEPDDSTVNTTPVVSQLQKMIDSDKKLAEAYGLAINVGAVFVSDENMKNSTLYVTLENVGPVSIVNLGADPELSEAMIRAMLDHGGYFGFMQNGLYVILNFSNKGFREALVNAMDEFNKPQNPVTDEGKNDSALHIADPLEIADAAGTLVLPSDMPGLTEGTGIAGLTSTEKSGVAGVRTNGEVEAAGVVSNNGDTNLNKKLNTNKKTNTNKTGKLVKIQDPKTPLADMPMDDSVDYSWWWIMVIFLLGETGRKMYKNHMEKAEQTKMQKGTNFG